MCASICHRWGPGRLPNHQHYQRLSTQKKIALWRPTCSLSTRTLPTRQLVLFTNPNVFSSSVWALVSPLPAETLWSERGQDIDLKIVQSESITFITWTDVRRVILLLQRSLQSCSVNAEVSGSAQLHVLHQIHLDKHKRLTVINISVRVNCVVSCQAHLRLLGQRDKVFLILLDAEDQIRDGFCLTKQFSLARGGKVVTVWRAVKNEHCSNNHAGYNRRCLTDAAVFASLFFFFLSSAFPLISPLWNKNKSYWVI